jgi:hypothetical protein
VSRPARNSVIAPLYGEVDKAGLMERRPSWLGRGAPSEPRSRPAARTCAGLDGGDAYRGIMIRVIIRNLHSDRRGITEAHAIGGSLG